MAIDVGSGEDVRRGMDEPVTRIPASAPEEGVSSPAAGPVAARPPTGPVAAGPSGFFRRHRLPLALAAIAFCLYAGSIVYILYGRGQLT